MNLVAPVREFIDSLVHVSARSDPLVSARHRGFIAPRILGGFIALGVLPLYLFVRGALDLIEALVVIWFLTPIAVAWFLSRTGRYEAAHALSAAALTGAVTAIAALSGGLASPAAVWLVLVPMEAALGASRRVVILAAALTIAAVAFLFTLGSTGLALLPAAASATLPLAEGASLLCATAYAALIALGVELQTRTGARLLSKEEERYRLLALNITDVISRHGRGGVVHSMSAAGEKLFGAGVRDLLGHGLFDRVHVADRPAYLTALAAAAGGDETVSLEFRVRNPHGEAGARAGPQFVWVEMRCRALAEHGPKGAAAEPRPVVAIMRDVTERKTQEQSVADARRDAERANAAKGRFLATMSHELRTPLNAIIGFSDMLMNEAALGLDASRRHDYARLINDSGQHLLSVVNLVLDMSKIETGNFVIAPEPFAPASVIRNCCDLLALKAHEAGLDIVVRVPGDLPEMVGDKRALKQVLFNLLSNAIKFTDRGGRVAVDAAAAEDQLTIVVEDTGVGISEADLPRVGDPFFQARSAYDRPYDGTGLGLSIVKGLVDLHGGSMQVESRVGIGTRVTINLPLDCESRHSRATVVDFGGGPRGDPISGGVAPASCAEPEVKKSA